MYITKGLILIRFWNYGLSIQKRKLMFSERYGYTKYLKVFGWVIKPTKYNKAEEVDLSDKQYIREALKEYWYLLNSTQDFANALNYQNEIIKKYNL